MAWVVVALPWRTRLLGGEANGLTTTRWDQTSSAAPLMRKDKLFYEIKGEVVARLSLRHPSVDAWTCEREKRLEVLG